MIHPISPHRRSLAGKRLAVALACAGALTLTGLPGLHLAEAASVPKPGVPCEELYDLSGTPVSSPSWGQNGSRPKSDWDDYDYTNQRNAMDGVTLPDDQAEQQKILREAGTDPKKWKEGDPRKVFASYSRYLEGQNGANEYGSFKGWLDDSYIDMAGRNPRGKAFERKAVKDLGLVGPDWICQEPVEYTDAKTGEKRYRIYDAVNRRTKELVEIKSGPNYAGDQGPKDRAVLSDPKYKDYRLRGVFGQSQTDETKTFYRNLAAQFGNGPDGKPRVTTYEHNSTPRATFKPGKYSASSPYLAPKGSTARGGATDIVNGSAPTPETMRKQVEAVRRNDPSGMRVRGPGGVDFSTLQLSYVGKPVKGKGVDYSFSADKAPNEDAGWGGKEKAQLISDAYFTWLALTPDKFWVNLNPDQPDKIMDKTFGKTDAGRVLLQADLEMKHDYARDMDPRKGLGKQYWDAMKAAGLSCGTVVRNWIVPEPAKVRVHDTGIYILDAPLKVNSVASDVKTPSPNGPCDLTAAQRKTSQRLVNQIIIPDVEHKVNTAPQYADLRRVYRSRVAAEYVRQQDAKAPSDYRAMINSNDVHRWPVRGKNASWTPRKTWDEYVKSFTKGDYSYPCEMAGQQKICVMGGVDFSKSPKRNISDVEFKAQHPHLQRSTQTSVQAMTDDADNDHELLLGGNTDGKLPSGGGQSPTPTPTPTGKPTGQPSAPASHTPGPGHSTPPGGQAPSTPPGKQDGGGGLAATGTQVLTLTGIAAALLAAGAALVWWRRRRTTGN
ncbi:LPXTG cell wall anchor domain-containing protein [Streptomyces sp. NBC_01014]|uniref:LPXTG cell wall anchor domain-containing protein n=1 Tax=Streptomyces sp. NBC_01014 TaxID=2903719 RepID=UPI00386A0B6B|nr:LPXTG cell wall anchor domain-containing protein [Streptomyces sp. NBC_01014]